MTADRLTPGQRGLIGLMRLCGSPLTREAYIKVNWNDEPPEDWDAEYEAELPDFLQGAEDDEVFDYGKALSGGYDED